jgi:hypothetical protein
MCGRDSRRMLLAGICRISLCLHHGFVPHRFRFGEVGRALQLIETKGEGILNPLIIFGDGRRQPPRIEGPKGKEVPLTREP